MSEQEKAKYRAQGIIEKMLYDARQEMEMKGRSHEYQERFWGALIKEMERIVDNEY